MLSFGLKLILLLLVIGGAIAIIGNYIGKTIGRRRLTVFNLRPRYTANAITVLTGILIACITIGTMLIVSQDARTALFGLETLRQNLSEKNSQLQRTTEELALRAAEKERIDLELAKSKEAFKRAEREIQALENVRAKLNKEVEVSRKGKVLFRVDEILLTSLIQAGPEKTKLETGLKQILSAADAYVRGFGVSGDGHLIFVAETDFDRALTTLLGRRGENIVKVVVNRNTVLGEEVQARLEVEENKIIYRAGEGIADTLISQSLSVPEIEQEIKKLLALTHLNAKKAGVLPDLSGALGSIAYADIFNLAKKIKTAQKSVNLKTVAKGNIYAVGPLQIDFKLFYR